MDHQTTSNLLPQSPKAPNLSQHDTQILTQLLSPGLVPPPPPTDVIDPSRPGPPASLLALEASILAPLNIERPSSPILRTAIDALTALIAQHPDHASAYNNRAQAVRLLLGDDLRVNESVWTDLSTAIALISGGAAENSTLERSRGQTQVSKHEASVLSKAYTQRAWLLWKLAKASPTDAAPASSPDAERRKPANDDFLTVQDPSSKQGQFPAQLLGLSCHDLEEMASRDFAMGGLYGDESARSMAVKTSPYAKLCEAIVKEAMKEDMLRDGRSSGSPWS